MRRLGMLAFLALAIGATAGYIVRGALVAHGRRSDPQSIEPWAIAWLRTVNDSGSPPNFATAMCGDGWYTFTRDSTAQCAGHGGAIIRFPNLMGPELFHRWMALRDSIREVAMIGRTESAHHAAR